MVQGSYFVPVQLRPVGQELVADLPQGGLIGFAGGIGDADDVEACVVGGAGGVEGIFTDNAPVGVSAAQACKGLEKYIRPALVERPLCLHISRNIHRCPNG